MYMNDIDVGLNDFLSIFADDVKFVNPVIDDGDRLNLQEALRKISAWSERWEMPSNVNRCHILHVGT